MLICIYSCFGTVIVRARQFDSLQLQGFPLLRTEVARPSLEHTYPSGYREPYPRGKVAGALGLPLTPSPFFPPLRMSGAIPQFSHTLSWHAQGKLYLLVIVLTGGCSCGHNYTLILVTHV